MDLRKADSPSENVVEVTATPETLKHGIKECCEFMGLMLPTEWYSTEDFFFGLIFKDRLHQNMCGKCKLLRDFSKKK